MLRINEAARRLGVTPTTLRRWEAEGKVHPVRTAGGERRYDEMEIERLRLSGRTENQGRLALEDAEEPEAVEAVEYVTDDEPPPLGRVPIAGPWDDRVREAKANLRVRRLELERESLERTSRDADERRQQRARDSARASEAQQAKVREREDEEQRLQSLRQHGDMLAALARAPISLRAEVTRDLASYVTPARFPRSASAQAYQYVSARVDDLLSPWREEQTREAEDAAAERESTRERQQRKELIQWGLSHADRETQLWDERDRHGVAREVKEALRDEIDSDSSRDEVIALVDEILREWDE
jgi:DNA-binding transcriptional MerR regulator